MIQSWDTSGLVFRDDWIVAGRRLQPFSIGHAQLLHRLGSPFANLDANVLAAAGRGDVAEALLVCRRSWHAAARLLKTRRGALALRWEGIRLGAYVADAMFGLVAYARKAWTMPMTWSKQVGRPSTTSETLAMLEGVMRQWGISRQVIYDTPLDDAIWDVFLHLHGKGQIEMVDSGDDDLFRAADALEAELKGVTHAS